MQHEPEDGPDLAAPAGGGLLDRLAALRAESLALAVAVEAAFAALVTLRARVRRDLADEALRAGQRLPRDPHGIAARRRALGLRQAELARLVGYSRSEVCGLETGARTSPGAVLRVLEGLERLEQTGAPREVPEVELPEGAVADELGDAQCWALEQATRPPPEGRR